MGLEGVRRRGPSCLPRVAKCLALMVVPADRCEGATAQEKKQQHPSREKNNKEKKKLDSEASFAPPQVAEQQKTRANEVLARLQWPYGGREP